MDTPEQIIAKRIAELPDYVKQAIGEAQATVKMRAIGQRYKLRIDQQTVMEREVMLVMLGFDNEGAFVRNLVAQAKIPLEDSQKIAADVGNEIFAHIRTAMRRMSEERGRPKVATPPPAKTEAARPPLQDVIPKQAPIPVPPAPSTVFVETPKAPPAVPATPVAVAPKPLEAVEKTLSTPQATPGTTVTVGIAPAKGPGYSNDPYREAIE